MKEVKASVKYLDNLFSNLRDEDLLELEKLGIENINEIYDICLDESNNSYFLETDDGKALAMGGAYETEKNSHKIARVWLLVSKEAKENKLSLYKYIKSKLKLFKTNYDILFNYIYKSNYSFLKFLRLEDFQILGLKNNADFKLFYFGKGGKVFDIRYFAGK